MKAIQKLSITTLLGVCTAVVALLLMGLPTFGFGHQDEVTNGSDPNDVHPFVDGQSPVFTSNTTGKVYGGKTGLIGSDFIDINGVVHFDVSFPAGSGLSESDGFRIYYSEPNVSKRWFEPTAGIDTVNCNYVGDGSGTCEIIASSSLFGNGFDPNSGGYFEGEQQFRVTHEDVETSTVRRVQYQTSSGYQDHISAEVVGDVSGPVGAFVNPKESTVTDPQQDTVDIVAQVKGDATSVKFVIENLQNNNVTTYEEVVDTSWIPSGIREFTYSWDISGLANKTYTIRATASSSDGRTSPIGAGTLSTTDWINTIKVTLDRDLNAKLLEQCTENKEAVERLTASVVDDARDRANLTTTLFHKFNAFLSSEGLSETYESQVIDIEDKGTTAWNSIQDMTATQNLNCTTDLGPQIDEFTEDFEFFASSQSLYNEALIATMQQVLEDL